MTIRFFCKHSGIDRLLLMTKLMSHLLSCREVHLYHYGCLQGRVGGCGWGGLFHHQWTGGGREQTRLNIYSVSTGGEGDVYEQMSHSYILTNTQLCMYTTHCLPYFPHLCPLIHMYTIWILLVLIAVSTGTCCHANCWKL